MSAKQPISDPGTYDEKQEAKIRALITRHAAYAESGSTFDPTGKYLCGSCSFRKGSNACQPVSGIISFLTGSCRLWDSAGKFAAGTKQLSQLEAGYAERPEAKGFGCSPRCEYASDSKVQPIHGPRDIWCGFWGLHVAAKACCSEEDGPDLILAPSESKSDNEV